LPDGAAFNPILRQIYEEGFVEERDGTRRDAFPVSLTRQDGVWQYDIVRETRVQRTLEIGMALGASSLFICQGLVDNGGGHHTAIDPFQEKWFDSIGALNVERAGYADMFRLIEQPSFRALPMLMEEDVRFDYVFIDGNHRFEHTLVDFFLAERLLDVGGYVVFHDPWLPAVRKVLAYLFQNRMDAFELDVRFARTPVSLPVGLAKLAGYAWKHPRDLGVAREFARKRFYNFCVFRKTADTDEEEFSRQWDQYRAF
jgi:predicted O-methyltransferase YrrM